MRALRRNGGPVQLDKEAERSFCLIHFGRALNQCIVCIMMIMTLDADPDPDALVLEP